MYTYMVYKRILYVISCRDVVHNDEFMDLKSSKFALSWFHLSYNWLSRYRSRMRSNCYENPWDFHKTITSSFRCLPTLPITVMFVYKSYSAKRAHRQSTGVNAWNTNLDVSVCTNIINSCSWILICVSPSLFCISDYMAMFVLGPYILIREIFISSLIKIILQKIPKDLVRALTHNFKLTCHKFVIIFVKLFINAIFTLINVL